MFHSPQPTNSGGNLRWCGLTPVRCAHPYIYPMTSALTCFVARCSPGDYEPRGLDSASGRGFLR
eukprot:3033459-Rhodomonas_salina.1